MVSNVLASKAMERLLLCKHTQTDKQAVRSSSAFRNKQIIILKSIRRKLDKKKTLVINHIITVYFGKYLQIFDLLLDGVNYFPVFPS